MREVNMGDGKILHMPDTEQRDTVAKSGYYCRCHERLGNDFYFLPRASCLWDKCDNPEGRQP